MPRPRARTTRSSLNAEQVLEVAAAAGDDDDLDLGVGVEALDGRDDLGHRAVALHGGVRDAELDRRPAQPRVAQDVLLGVAVSRR